MYGKNKPVWKKKAPKTNKKSTKLTKKQKEEAMKLAKNAGRTYPNLVDNMRVARKKNG